MLDKEKPIDVAADIRYSANLPRIKRQLARDPNEPPDVAADIRSSAGLPPLPEKEGKPAPLREAPGLVSRQPIFTRPLGRSEGAAAGDINVLADIRDSAGFPPLQKEQQTAEEAPLTEVDRAVEGAMKAHPDWSRERAKGEVTQTYYGPPGWTPPGSLSETVARLRVVNRKLLRRGLAEGDAETLAELSEGARQVYREIREGGEEAYVPGPEDQSQAYQQNTQELLDAQLISADSDSEQRLIWVCRN